MAEIVVGVNSVAALLENYPEMILSCHCLARPEGRLGRLIQQLNQIGIKTQVVDAKTLDKLAPRLNHQGVVCQVKQLPVGQDTQFSEQVAKAQRGAWLFLDGVTDPHNLGACMRSAAAFAVQGVVAPRDASCGLNATVMNASAGTALLTPFFQVTNLVRALEQLKSAHYWTYAASGKPEASSLYQTEFEQKHVIVLGSEGSGLRQKTQAHCDFSVSIPMAPGVESLNVSVACGILLSSAYRSVAQA